MCCDRLVKVTDALGFETNFTYDPVGNRLTVKDANNLTTVTDYDGRHRPWRITNAAGEQTVITYIQDATTLPASSIAGLGLGSGANGSAMITTDPTGKTTTVIRDGMGRTVRVIDNIGNQTTTSYDVVFEGLLITTQTDALGHTTSAHSDGTGRTRKTVDALGKPSTADYDANGNRVTWREADGVGQDCTFDLRNRDLTCKDTAGAMTQKAWDLVGNLVTEIDAMTNATQHVYDARNRKTSTTDRINAETKFTYDLVGNLTSITDAQDGVTLYHYDQRNLLIAEVFPAGQVGKTRRAYAYDAGRRLAQREVGIDDGTTTIINNGDFAASPAIELTSYGYDDANRLTTRTYPAESTTDTFGYDDAGRLIQAVSNRYGTTVQRTYDSVGRLDTETQTVLGTSNTVGYQYDADHRTTRVTYGDGTAVTRTWTERNQLDLLSYGTSGSETAAAHYDYSDGGRKLSATYGNGLVETRTYRMGSHLKKDGLVESISIPGVIGFICQYNDNKWKLQEHDAIVAAGSQSFAYDNEGRVTDWQQGNLSGSPVSTQTWDLSKVGDWNQTVKDGVAETRTHTNVHELTGINRGTGIIPLTYDQKGNLTGDDQGQGYTWDAENRLATARIPLTSEKVGGIAAYTYDALGRRLAKTVQGMTTIFWHDGAQVIRKDEAPSQAPASGAGGVADDGALAGQATTPATGGILTPSQVLYRLNFQPNNSAIPAGFIADKGRVYGLRTNGATYGWTADRNPQARQRNVAQAPEFDTNITVTGAADTASTWTIALPVPAGGPATAAYSFPIALVAGDAASVAATNHLAAGSLTFTDADPGNSMDPDYQHGDFDGYVGVATVGADGLLTIAAATGAVKPALCWIEIGQMGSILPADAASRMATLIGRMTDDVASAAPRVASAKSFVWGAYVDELVMQQNGAAKFYAAANHLYSVAALTDAAGAVVQRNKYDAYGKRTVTGLAVFAHGFTGYREDAETGLYYARARMYSAGLGRFIERDPLTYVDGLSMYMAYFIPNSLDWNGLNCQSNQNGPVRGGSCCGGVFIQAKDLTTGCCNGIAYNKTTAECKNGVIRHGKTPGSFWHYGNWGGPGWVNDDWGYESDPFPRKGDLGYKEPIDARDNCYYYHDTCINDCYKMKCPTKTKMSDCVRACDHALASCLRSTGNGGLESWAFDTIIPKFVHGPGAFKEFPDDDKCCQE